MTTRHADRSIDTGSGCWTMKPPSIGLRSNSHSPGGLAVITRRFFLASNASSAVVVVAGRDDDLGEHAGERVGHAEADRAG